MLYKKKYNVLNEFYQFAVYATIIIAIPIVKKNNESTKRKTKEYKEKAHSIKIERNVNEAEKK